MDIVISDHLQRKNYLLLKSQLPFKNNSGMIKYEKTLYGGLIHSMLDDCSFLGILLRGQFIKYINRSKFLEIVVYEKESNSARHLNYSNDIIVFNSIYDNIISYSYSYNLSNKMVSFEYFDKVPGKIYKFDINQNGKIAKIFITDDVLSLHILDNEIRLYIDNRLVIDADITNSTIKNVIEYYRKVKFEENILALLNLEIHPNKSIKKFGIILDNKKEYFFYESDELEKFEISCYRNDELHGYYFNSKTEEQGFYERGNQVDFWKEREQIIKYKRDRIFFIFPVLFF